jgi:hypothetical protein
MFLGCQLQVTRLTQMMLILKLCSWMCFPNIGFEDLARRIREHNRLGYRLDAQPVRMGEIATCA